MGYGAYSEEAHRALTQGRAEAPLHAVFDGRSCDPAMNPFGVTYRESRDSADHPNATGVIFALDVSGSMETIPQELATKTLPTFMATVLPVLPDAQVLFLAFGNAYADRSPLQVGQFESTAALMDRWLAATHVELGGGGLGESYDLALYFASRHTAMDCVEKRGSKGYLFMTGDEVPFIQVDPAMVKKWIGDGLEAPIPVHEVVAEAQRKFHVFFLIPDAARADRYSCGAVWRELLRERCLVLEATEDTAIVCATCIAVQERRLYTADAVRRWLDASGVATAAAERVVRVVTPFAEALGRGEIAPPGSLVRRDQEPGFGG